MKANELRDMTEEELSQRYGDDQHELFNLRRQQVSGQLERPSRITLLRRESARIQTLLHERKRGAE